MKTTKVRITVTRYATVRDYVHDHIGQKEAGVTHVANSERQGNVTATLCGVSLTYSSIYSGWLAKSGYWETRGKEPSCRRCIAREQQ